MPSPSFCVSEPPFVFLSIDEFEDDSVIPGINCNVWIITLKDFFGNFDGERFTVVKIPVCICFQIQMTTSEAGCCSYHRNILSAKFMVPPHYSGITPGLAPSAPIIRIFGLREQRMLRLIELKNGHVIREEKFLSRNPTAQRGVILDRITRDGV